MRVLIASFLDSSKRPKPLISLSWKIQNLGEILGNLGKFLGNLGTLGKGCPVCWEMKSVRTDMPCCSAHRLRLKMPIWYHHFGAQEVSPKWGGHPSSENVQNNREQTRHISVNHVISPNPMIKENVPEHWRCLYHTE